MSWQGASGVRAWVVQRVTAVYMAVFVIFCLISLATADVLSHPAWRDWLARPLVNAAVALFFVGVLLHAWVGVRNVIMDYIGNSGWRFVLQSLLALVLGGMGLWVLRILYTVGG